MKTTSDWVICPISVTGTSRRFCQCVKDGSGTTDQEFVIFASCCGEDLGVAFEGSCDSPGIVFDGRDPGHHASHPAPVTQVAYEAGRRRGGMAGRRAGCYAPGPQLVRVAGTANETLRAGHASFEGE